MKILLANFDECPENMHFEQALIRAARAIPGASLDIVHDFSEEYRFAGSAQPPGGRRARYAGLPEMRERFRDGYDALVALDFAWRKQA